MKERLAWMILLVGLGACAGSPPAADQAAPAPALELDVVDAAGRRWTLRDSEAKPLLIDFWATWCRPCVEALPSLKAFHEANSAKVQVLGVAVDTQGWQVVEPVVKRHGLSYPVAVAPARLSTDFGAPGYPFLALVHHGKVVRRLLGKHSQADLEKELAEYLR